jgi:hypothetical protein
MKHIVDAFCAPDCTFGRRLDRLLPTASNVRSRPFPDIRKRQVNGGLIRVQSLYCGPAPTTEHCSNCGGDMQIIAAILE